MRFDRNSRLDNESSRSGDPGARLRQVASSALSGTRVLSFSRGDHRIVRSPYLLLGSIWRAIELDIEPYVSRRIDAVRRLRYDHAFLAGR